MQFFCGVCIGENIAFYLNKKMSIKDNTKMGIIFNERPKSQTYGGGYIPKYVLSNLEWWKSNRLMTYIDQIKYQEFESNRKEWLNNNEVLNFDIKHNRCKGSKLEKSPKENKNDSNKGFTCYPENIKLEVIGASIVLKNQLLRSIFKQKVSKEIFNKPLGTNGSPDKK